jgi:rhodanese-related sulfurtransferase
MNQVILSNQIEQAMKKTRFIQLMVLISLGGCHMKTEKIPVAAVTAKETAGLLSNQFAVLVDVREEDEVKESGMAQGALWIPTSKIEDNAPEWQSFVKSAPKDKQIIFYCKMGGRAGRAAQRMADLGYKTGNMGGFESWTKEKLPIKK